MGKLHESGHQKSYKSQHIGGYVRLKSYKKLVGFWLGHGQSSVKGKDEENERQRYLNSEDL